MPCRHSYDWPTDENIMKKGMEMSLSISVTAQVSIYINAVSIRVVFIWYFFVEKEFFKSVLNQICKETNNF